MSELEGKVALVTGAAGGIGRATALRFAREGAKVVVCDLGCSVGGEGHDPSAATAVCEEIRADGGLAVESCDDISTLEGARNAVRVAVENFGALDVLVTAAGIIHDKTLLKMDERSWDQVVGVVLKGTFLTLQSAARQMVAQGTGGRVVVLTGLPGYLGNFAQSNFAAACGGVHGLMRTAAIELQKHKISVNAVAPLATTRLTQTLPVLEGFDNITVEHVVPMILMLASDRCAERTGVTVAVSGARMYAYRLAESAGKFKESDEGVFTTSEIEEHWHAITK